MSGFFLSLSPSALQRRKARRKADISVLMTLELIFIIFFSFPWDVGLFFSRSPNPSVGFLTRTAG